MSNERVRLIVDSGSTKSDWVLIGLPTQKEFQTKGFNPVFHSSEFIHQEIASNQDILAVADQVQEIYFYGAGCSSVERNEVVKNGLIRIFHNANITVDHDLTACAYATFEGEKSISCILGTGSNACMFDGEKILQAVPSLGFILGDEGGGAFFGKEIISQFLYGRLPEELQHLFQTTYKLNKEQIITRVYKEPYPNTYLASFMEFAVQNASHPYIKELIFNGFLKFNEIHVCAYPDFRSVKVHYIGSIAYLFSEELKRACNQQEIIVGKIIQKPIEGLVHYHQSYL